MCFHHLVLHSVVSLDSRTANFRQTRPTATATDYLPPGLGKRAKATSCPIYGSCSHLTLTTPTPTPTAQLINSTCYELNINMLIMPTRWQHRNFARPTGLGRRCGPHPCRSSPEQISLARPPYFRRSAIGRHNASSLSYLIFLESRSITPRSAPISSARSVLLITNRSLCVMPGPPFLGILSPPLTSIT